MGRGFGIIWGLLLVFMLSLAVSAGSQPFSAEVRLAQAEVFVGEPVTMQIIVSGSESPDQPDLSQMDGFSVSFQGGSQNSSRSISIINGRMTQDVRQGYVFSYQIIPLREGRIEIPPISVSADGQTASTRPVSILAQKPTETDEFKLRMRVSKNSCYVGEPVTLTVTWYLAGDVDTASFSIPFLENKDRFFVADPPVDTRSGKQYYRIPANSGEIIVEKGQGELNGRVYSTLSFQKVLIPGRSGTLSIDPVTVTYKTLTGYRNQRRPFGDEFFSNFFNQNMRQGVYRQGIAPSNRLDLEVKELPMAGRPEDFSGLVGDYSIAAEATPTTVNVGDPVTLTVAVSGPEFLEPVELPPLQKQPDLIRDFKVPSERAAGEISGDRKIFTHTIRPLRADVSAVPPLLLSYFDTRTETYQTARTAPIPLTVSPTRMVTAKDAEGLLSNDPAGSQIETWAAGIAHNYEDDSVLNRQTHDPALWLSSPAGLAVLMLPPVFYFLLFAGTWVYRKKKTDPGLSLAKKAGIRLAREISAAQAIGTPEMAAAILEAFKTYLRAKLRLQPGVLTFQDVAGPLRLKKIDPEALAELESLFADGEAARYGNARAGGESAVEMARNLQKKLDRLL
ncbi:MAG: protein BatD [Desulfobacteraceae bacterium]|nr:MAG: protein BatD [Desulfobacteraceae bacterium]